MVVAAVGLCRCELRGAPVVWWREVDDGLGGGRVGIGVMRWRFGRGVLWFEDGFVLVWVAGLERSLLPWWLGLPPCRRRLSIATLLCGVLLGLGVFRVWVWRCVRVVVGWAVSVLGACGGAGESR